jgi:hypothetical protein
VPSVPITPDTKDWTWVLERPCPECGFRASELDRAEVGTMIRENARSWLDMLGDSERVALRPSDDVWSALEYACHVRDVFRLYDERLRLMLEQDDPHYPNWDQDAAAVADRYPDQDPGSVAVELDGAARRLADRFEQVAGAQWQRTGMRSDGARFTIESFARYLIHDPVHHLHDVERGLAALDHRA